MASDVPGELFSGQRSQNLGFASVDVFVPPGHKPGQIELPKQLPPDPRQHFVIGQPERFVQTSQFQDALSNYLNSRAIEDRKILLFVHGYNTDMSSAILQISQFVEDSGYDGVPLLFSWASSGQTLKYVYDINSVLAARDHLTSMFSVLQLPSIDSYDVVAHSMGTLLVMEAARQAAITTGLNPTQKVRNVVLAAPDIDWDVFLSQVRSFPTGRYNMVVLVASDDKALKASRRVAGGIKRLGQVPATELDRLGVIAIDLSEVDDESTYSHAKYKDSPEVVKLLGDALKEGSSVDNRPNLTVGQTIGVGVDGAIKILTGGQN
ncbi:alpha/beta hydrolase [Ruegeria arenilitoris]|uniref:alpha/beta hydrolase n=1 Tax=Ruegeria arenilitoris TaxID=1173585 RepID=UPI00147B993A|nr:alpha/beta hydrolase [Ruegeria arenilitoris]